MTHMSEPWRKVPKKVYKERDAKVTSRMMRAVKSQNGKAEVALRKELWKQGLRYRLYDKKLIGKPDLVFKKRKTVVFVDGDFWHGRALVEEGVEGFTRGVRTAKSDWWLAKIQRNVERDKVVTAKLKSEGWLVLRYWESAVKKNVAEIAKEIEGFLREEEQQYRTTFFRLI